VADGRTSLVITTAGTEDFRRINVMQTTVPRVFPEDCAIIELGCVPPRGIGFRKGQIEYFDGTAYRQVSLKQSVQLYILLVMLHEIDDEPGVPESCAAAAYLKWLRLIARDLK